MSSNKEYKPRDQLRTGGRNADEAIFVDADTGIDAAREDREAGKSEQTNRIPQSKLSRQSETLTRIDTIWTGEINDLQAASGGVKTTGRTRPRICLSRTRPSRVPGSISAG